LVRHGDVGDELVDTWMQETLYAMEECGASESSVGTLPVSGAGGATAVDMVMEKAGAHPCLARATRADAARFLVLKREVVEDALNSMLARADWLEARLYGVRF